MNPYKFLLSTPEVCDALAIGRTRLYELLAQGVVPQPAKNGRTNAWTVAAIEEAARRIANGAAAPR